MQRTQDLVGDAVAVGGLGLDDEHVRARGARALAGREPQVAVDRHALAALAGDQGHALVAHLDHRLQGVGEGFAIQVAIAPIDMRTGCVVQASVLVHRVVEALLDRDAALVLELDLDEAQLRVGVFAHPHLAAPAAALVVVVVAVQRVVVEVAGLVGEGALAVDLEHVEVQRQLGQRRAQHVLVHHVLVVQALEHRGLGVQGGQRDRAEAAEQAAAAVDGVAHGGLRGMGVSQAGTVAAPLVAPRAGVQRLR